MERKEPPPWMGFQWPHGDFMLTLRGATDTWVFFISLQDDPPHNSLQIAPGTRHGYHTSNAWQVVQQKRGSVWLMDGTLIHRGAIRPGRAIFPPFVPETFHTHTNVVEPGNVPDLMFVEPEVPEVGEVEEDPPATSSGSDLQPLAPRARRLSWSAPLKTPRGWRRWSPTWVMCGSLGMGLGTLPLACAHSRWRDLGQRRRMLSIARVALVPSVVDPPSHGGQAGAGPRRPRLALVRVLSEQPRPHTRS